MNIKTDLLKKYINDFIRFKIEDFEINENEIADTTAIKILDEIRTVVCNPELDDFSVVEEIVCIFEKYDIDVDGRHDFG